MKFLNNSGLQYVLEKLQGKYLARDNAEAFTPTGNYNPATKKYVDDMFVSGGVSGSGTIDITDHVVSVKIDGTDKVLSTGAAGLLATLSLSYDTQAKKIKLFGKSQATPISEIDASDFIRDSFLNSASYDPSTNKLTLTFNTESGKSPISIDLSGLVDTAPEAGLGLSLSADKYNILLDSASEAYLSVSVSGLKLSGLTTALAGKVDKVTGKGLSANDYTSAEKTKLAGIATAATADSALTNAEIDSVWSAVFTAS